MEAQDAGSKKGWNENLHESDGGGVMFDHALHEKLKAEHDGAMAVANRLRAQAKSIIEVCRVTHHSAKAAWSIADKLLRIDYSGPINQQTYIVLDRGIAVQRRATVGALEYHDKAMTMLSCDLIHDKQAWSDDTPPSAVIVRPDQYARSLAFCQLLAKCGVHRMAFLQPSAAHDWLEQYQV